MIDVIIDHTGATRKLGWTPPPDDRKPLRAMRATVTRIPRSDWYEVDNVTRFGTKFILDQGNYGAVRRLLGSVGHDAAAGLAGQEFVRLSGAFTYDQINGGQDNGANIIDSMGSIESLGTPPENVYPKPIFRAKQVPAGAPLYTEDVACQITDFDDVCSCIIMGGFPQFPISVEGNFQRFNSAGAAGVGSRKFGNHSVHGAGLVQVSGTWFVLMPNSWSTAWGPFTSSKPAWAGCCLLSEESINRVSGDGDAYCHLSTLNPSGQTEAPEPVQ